MCEFSDYVQQQQALRKPHTATATTDKSAVKSAPEREHAELDILDTLNLADDRPKVKLKQLFLDDSEAREDSLRQLRVFVNTRLDEGRGEGLFDIGLEDNGESQCLTESEWDAALARFGGLLETMNADSKLLMTKNVPGSPVDVGNEIKKEPGCVGKLLIRRRPVDLDDTIETRIAVVGNVDAGKS